MIFLLNVLFRFLHVLMVLLPSQRAVTPWLRQMASDVRLMMHVATDIREALEKGKSYDRVLVSLLIDLTHASSNLENVPISWLDTRTLIEFGERPDGLTEHQMRIVLNHKAAISYLREHAGTLSLSRRDLFDIHSLIIDSLLGDVSAAGRLRSVVVRFDDSRYLPPDNPHQLNEVFDMFCEKAVAISNPYEQAFFTMAFIPYLQPFQDGNKRVSRIGMNIPLVKNALAPFSFADIRRRDYKCDSVVTFGYFCLPPDGSPDTPLWRDLQVMREPDRITVSMAR